MNAGILALALLAAAAPAADAPVPHEGRPLRVVAVEGAPPDSASRADFMAGFDEALSAGEFAVERRESDGSWAPAGARANRFAPGAGPGQEDAWSLQVVVRVPPPFTASRKDPATGKTQRHADPGMRASRGMTVAVVVLSPEAIAAGARPMPEHFAFAFPAPAAPAGVIGEVPGGYRFPWRRAGAATAALALEQLHRMAGDLDDGTRCDLAPAVRAGVVR